MTQNDSSLSPPVSSAVAGFLSPGCTGSGDEEIAEADFEEIIALFLAIEPEYSKTNQALA